MNIVPQPIFRTSTGEQHAPSPYPADRTAESMRRLREPFRVDRKSDPSHS
ncbi:hypothetical protein [Actinoplanes sp. G11-F43]